MKHLPGISRWRITISENWQTSHQLGLAVVAVSCYIRLFVWTEWKLREIPFNSYNFVWFWLLWFWCYHRAEFTVLSHPLSSVVLSTAKSYSWWPMDFPFVKTRATRFQGFLPWLDDSWYQKWKVDRLKDKVLSPTDSKASHRGRCSRCRTKQNSRTKLDFVVRIILLAFP